VKCGPGASCEVDCRGAVDCSKVECETGAQCVLHCGASPTCGFMKCPGGVQDCGDGVRACGLPCPI
jgi:hypothetical protein